jgi:hypothetical protein
MVKKLVDAEDFAGLRAILQQYIKNAMYHICFGLYKKFVKTAVTEEHMAICC